MRSTLKDVNYFNFLWEKKKKKKKEIVIRKAARKIGESTVSWVGRF